MMPTPYTLFLACFVALGAAAQDVRQRSDLDLVQRQITSIEQLGNRTSSGSVNAAGARYRFDFSKFAADLERVRQGIHDYLSPSRAQPADVPELSGDYRAEASHSSHPDEHD